MPGNKAASQIQYPFEQRPAAGETMMVAPGIHWLRMPLPFALGHINLWLLEDGNRWTIVDTGVHTDDSKNLWRKTFASTMRERAVERIIVTHLHPDHAGCAGWLCEQTGAELWMTREEYFLCRILVADAEHMATDTGSSFYAAAGLAADSLHHYQKMFGFFAKFVTPLPESHRRLQAGDELTIGQHQWKIIVGRGHSPEHACLFSEELNLLISGDQLLPTISSNVSVYPTEPLADPLHQWMTSLAALKNDIPHDVLVLPAHGKPFRGAHLRVDGLIEEHRDALQALEAMCASPKRAIDVFPVLFKREINASNLIMATGEALAHLNYLLARLRLTVETDGDGVNWYRQA